MATADRRQSPHLGRLDDFCSFPKADVAILTSIGQVWDFAADWHCDLERPVTLTPAISGYLCRRRQPAVTMVVSGANDE